MAKRKPKAAGLTFSEAVIDRVVALVVSLRSRSDVRRVCMEDENLQLTHEQAAAAIDEAQRRIQLAASCDFDFELGSAKTRLVELFEHTTKAAQYRTALLSQKEINKLLGLYPAKGETEDEDPAGDADEALAQLAAARQQLAPLVDADEDEPLDEIARRVVALFTSGASPKPARKK